MTDPTATTTAPRERTDVELLAARAEAEEEPWRSGPLTLATAARVWSAAAGIAGAFVPAAFASVAAEVQWGDHIASPYGQRPWTGDDRVRLLEIVLEEATRRAEWRQAVIACGSVPIRLAEIVHSRLEWRSETNLEIAVVLYHLGADTLDGPVWEVAIEGGVHVTRQAAAEGALARDLDRDLTRDERTPRQETNMIKPSEVRATPQIPQAELDALEQRPRHHLPPGSRARPRGAQGRQHGARMSATIINLTPHSVTVGDLTLPPSGTIARATEERTERPPIVVPAPELGPDAVRQIPTATVRYTGLVDLPDPQPDVLLVVSVVVVQASRQHRLGGYVGDLLVPGDQIRDDAGRVIGCRCLYWSEDPVEEVEPAPGWEDRVVERARREGVLR